MSPRDSALSFMYRRKSHRVAAFSLLEMLIAIGILAVLAALILPAIQRSMQRADQARCLANLRQIYAGVIAYVSDNAGCLPPNRVPGKAWFQGVFPDYLPIAKVFACPADKAGFTARDPAKPNGKVSYGPLAPDSAATQEVSPFNKRLAAFSKPSVSVLLTEGHVAGCQLGEDWYRNYPAWISRVPQAHDGGRRASVLFLDGHISPMSRSELTEGDIKKQILLTFPDIPNLD